VTAAATYYIAETYSNFGKSLLQSEKPTNLNAAELKDYEDTLDEQAFPFEEKAIKVHEKNMEMLRAGVFDDWTKKSLERLTELMPGRYAKPEMSIGFLTEMETYAYRSPSAPVVTPTVGNAATTPGKPDAVTANANTTSSKSATATVNANNTGKPDPTTNNANATPSKPDQTTQPAPQAAEKGTAKRGTSE
jgi:hypothetical protein